MYAVYVRVSTDKDEQLSSIDNQVDICRNWLERNGYEWNEGAVYKDEGISGTLFAERPAIQSILKKAKQKEINMVIFKSISRLARDLKDSLEIREVFLAHNVRIISVEEAYDSDKAGKNDMAFELWSMFAAQYSRTLSSSISAALTAKARRGEAPWVPAFGYGRDDDGKITIIEEEAAAVREMYRLYSSGLGYMTISKIMNERGFRPRKAPHWSISTISQILKNPIYTGRYVLNKQQKVKVAGKKKTVNIPPDKWIVLENHHEAIIPQELFDLCANRTNKQKRRKAASWNELRGLLYCKHCGKMMRIANSGRKLEGEDRYKFYYLKCHTYRTSGCTICVNHNPITYTEVRDLVLQQLFLCAPDMQVNYVDNVREENMRRIEELERALQKLKEKRKNLVKLQIEGLLDVEEFAEMRVDIEKEIDHSEQQIYTLQQNEYIDNTAQNIRDAFKFLTDTKGERDLTHVFQMLVERIEVHQDTTVDIQLKVGVAPPVNE